MYSLGTCPLKKSSLRCSQGTRGGGAAAPTSHAGRDTTKGETTLSDVKFPLRALMRWYSSRKSASRGSVLSVHGFLHARLCSGTILGCTVDACRILEQRFGSRHSCFHSMLSRIECSHVRRDE